jgi:hypothetical protein
VKAGDLRVWESVQSSELTPFLIIDISPDGVVTVLDGGTTYEFRHHDIDMYSSPCEVIDESR